MKAVLLLAASFINATGQNTASHPKPEENAAVLSTKDAAPDNLRPKNLTGTWAAQIPGRSSELPVIDVIIRLVQKGGLLTGKLYGDTEDLPIANGAVEDGKVRFIIETEGYGGKYHWIFEGGLEEGLLVLHRSREDAVSKASADNKRPPQKIVFRKMT